MDDVRAPIIHERLVNGRAYLERHDWEGSSGGSPVFGKAVEDRIVWRELLDLELQDIDEQIERASAIADTFYLDIGRLR